MRNHFNFRNMTAFTMGLIVLLTLATLSFLNRQRAFGRKRYGRRKPSLDTLQLTAPSPATRGFPSKKPDWVRCAMLQMRDLHPGWGHRKLADAFNLRYFAATGMTVGYTWVYELLKQHAYEALHRQRELKHRIPEPQPCNRMWGIDTTCVTDAGGMGHIVLGVVDHGSRLNIALRRLKRFNAWTLLGTLFLAFGEYGMPCMLKLDNHPVHRARWFKRIMRRAGVRLRFTALASPWQNGRIERLFGTLKSLLHGFVIRNTCDLDRSLDQFRFWYNAVRPHQHLGGRTPAQVWHGIDPYRRGPKQAQWFEVWDGRLRGWVLRY